MDIHKNLHHEVHFEVHCRDGGTWIILDLFHDRDRALAVAEKIWKQQKYKAVRVIRETYSQRSNSFDTMELAYHGRKFKMGAGDESSAAQCLAPADFYSAEGRRTIGQLLFETLSVWQVTPTELLHCPKHYYRLEGSGTLLQAAVQKAAVAQAKVGGTTIQERIKQIYALVERAAIRIRSEWEEGNVAEILDNNIDETIEGLSGLGENRRFLFTAALSRDLLRMDGAHSKVSRLLTLIRPDHPDWALRSMDAVISELVVLPNVAIALAGDANVASGANGASEPSKTSGLAELLIRTAHLARGASEPALAAEINVEEIPADDADQDDLERLREFLKDGHMPQTRRALLGVVARKLTSSERLTDGPLDEELEALTGVRLALEGAEEELLGQITLIDALEDRCRRFLNPQFIAEYLEDMAGPQDSLKKLMALEVHCVGLQNKRRIANHILPLLLSSNSELHFTSSHGNPVDRMRYLAKLQTAINGSGMTTQHKERMVDRLDQLCHTTMSNSRLLDVLEKRAGDSTESAKKLLAMIAGECFTEGAAKTAATDRLQNYLTDPALAALIAKKTDDPEHAAARNLILALATRAGIELSA